MARGEVRYTIRAEDKSKQAIDSAKKNAQDLEKETGKLGETLRGAFQVAAIVAAAAAIKEVAQAVVGAYSQAEQAERRLAVAAQNNPYLTPGAADRIAQFNDELSRNSVVTDQAADSMAAYLAASGRTEEQITAIIQTAADVSSVMGDVMSFDMAVESLNTTFTGTPGQMEDYVNALGTLTEEQLRAGDAIELVRSQFDGMASENLQTTQGAIQQFQNAFSELGETIGEIISGPLVQFITRLVDVINTINTTIQRFRAMRQLEDSSFETVGEAERARDAGRGAMDDLNARMAPLRRQLDQLQQQGGTGVGGPNQLRADSLLIELQLLQDEFDSINQSVALANDFIRAHAETQQVARQSAEEFMTALGTGSAGATGAAKEFNKTMLALVDTDPAGKFSEFLDAQAAMTQAMADYEAGQMITSLPGNTDPSLGQQVGAGIMDMGLGSLNEHMSDFSASLVSAAASGNWLNVAFAALAPVIDSFFSIVGPAIDGILAPLMPILIAFGEILAQQLSPILTILAPIFTYLAVALEIVLAPLRFFGDLMEHIADVIRYAIGRITFWTTADNVAAPGQFESDAFSGLGDRINDIINGTAPGMEEMTGAAGGGAAAQYSTGRALTVNVQINTEVIAGEEGIRGLAVLIRDEIRAAEALGY